MERVLEKDEKIIWEGKPQKTSYLVGRIIPLLFVLLVFAVFGILGNLMLNQGETVDNQFTWEASRASRTFDIANLIVYIPVILVLVIIVITFICKITEYKKLQYVITNKRAIIQKGIFGYEYRSIDYTKISDVKVKIGIINQIFNTGTIILLNEHVYNSGDGNTPGHYRQKVDESNSFLAIENPYEVFNKLKEVSRNIRTDMYYPNDLRPEENKGYKTDYKE